ncbi:MULTISPECIES: ABC transporter ATP-binding protein/permease [unclassified Rathayibacter]|uniref:ABC transporter ATP-binding protein/permease n=1 Tax=unclassified Rathayibacter TaxID=2609250 RepID=UPI00188A4C4E|nr:MULTISPECIES: ABC transporter ATP-binding protein/permease [unclassified Rathayibacter]MBF4463201.1 ABC transporter ATP-binding protein/permease [Rathayibacter sp. VKM Ac-2879]MBF4504562.1 ABC transporter ATP-binding protein/permease [Rathayibacter sp. VKM Ac-2878]
MTTSTPPLLSLRNITRTFGSTSTGGIRDISFDIYPGEFVAIVGTSGAGKSTLLNILGLLDRPTAGAFFIDGIDTAGLPERRRNRLRSHRFGFVFQSSFVLGHDSVIDNAALGLRIQGVPLRDRGTEARRALQLVGIDHRAATDARLLSGGERQRLAIARAVATRPEVIFADEPTGNLDSVTGENVLQRLLILHATGTTVILITHDADLAARAHRQIRITDGRVVSDTGSRPSRPTEPAAPTRRVMARRRLDESLADDLGEAVTSLSARYVRTGLLTVAFTLGVGGLIAALGVSESASAQVSQRLTAAALDEVRITVPGGADLLTGGTTQLEDWIASARALPHVVDVGYLAQAGVEAAHIRHLSTTEEEPTASLQLISADPTYLRLVGAVPDGPDTRGLLATSPVTGIALLGTAAARALDTSSPGPGAAMWINDRRVSVVGTLTAGARAPGIDNTIVVSPDVLASSPSVSVSLLVRTEPGYPAPLAEALPLAMDPGNPGRFTVETVADLRALRYGVSTDLGSLIGLISAVLLTLATISASTTMYLSVHARAAEIALRRAIGASRNDVARLFLCEGLIIGVIGGITGAVLGTVTTVVAAYAQGWTALLPPSLTPVSIALGALTGIVSAIVPAWAAGRQEPANAIKN